jgi:hypothetical protein
MRCEPSKTEFLIAKWNTGGYVEPAFLVKATLSETAGIPLGIEICQQ